MIFGFIGLGNMATAIIGGMRGSEGFSDAVIWGYDRHPEKAERLRLPRCGSLAELSAHCDVLVLAVKPQALEALLTELAPLLSPRQLLVSIAAGKPVRWYEERCPGTPFVRVMPNISAAVRAGVSAVCGGSLAAPEQIALVKALFAAIGSVYELPEDRFSVFSAIAGASPAYTALYIDALASAAVRAGLPKATALSIAADAVLGSARLLRESGSHPAVLADQVCSPGGTTIEGLHCLRSRGFESAVYEAIAAVIAKDQALGK